MNAIKDAFPRVVPKQRFVEYCKFYDITDEQEIQDVRESFEERGYRIKQI